MIDAEYDTLRDLGVAPAAACATYEGARLHEVAPFWRALEQNTRNPMQQYIWSGACSGSLSTGGDPLLVVVRTGPHTGAIAPLVRLTDGPRRLVHLGVRRLHEPADFLHSDRDALQKLAESLVESGAPLFLQRVPADSPTVAAIKDAYRGRGLVVLRPSGPYPRIVLHEGWQAPESQLNSGRRSDLRRAIRRAEEMGPVRCEILSPAPTELPPLLEEALGVEAAGWKGRSGTAIANDPLRGAFYRQYAAAASEVGILRLCFLRIAGRAAAMQFAVECAGAFWLLKIGYREEFARCSPGMLLTAETIKYAASKGLSSYEFLGSPDQWTRVWTKDERPCVSVRAYPLHLRSIATLAAEATDLARSQLARIASRRTRTAPSPDH